MFESRDDIHILLMFWFQTVRESKEADEVCQGETLSNCRFIVGVESQIPSLAALFSLRGSGFQDFKSPYDVFTGKRSTGAEVFSDRAQTRMTGMKCGLRYRCSVCATKQMSSVQQMFDESHCSSQGNKPLLAASIILLCFT